MTPLAAAQPPISRTLVPSSAQFLRIETLRFPVSDSSNLGRSEQKTVEHQAGRRCAALAMASLGHSGHRVTSGVSGEPVWPAGLVGSISHCGRWAAAAVARSATWSAIGIDCEMVMTEVVAAEVAHLVAGADELARATRTMGNRRVALTLLFSAKESYYKALSPRLPRDIDFLDAELNIQVHGDFDLVWRHPDFRCDTTTGRFCWLDDETLLTLVAVPAATHSQERKE